jgi:hypothetical protein
MKFTPERTENFKWPVSVSRKIGVSTERIWDLITRPGNLEDFHPYCKKNPVQEWPGAGSKDEVHYYSGWVLLREFVNWEDGIGYDLLIGREGGRKSYVTWRLTEDQEGTGSLRITIFPHNLQHIPIGIRWIPHITMIQPGLNSYLDAVLKGLEWFIISGETVRKDQFGTHKWFSIKE